MAILLLDNQFALKSVFDNCLTGFVRNRKLEIARNAFGAYTWEVLVLNGADHGECGVVGRSGLRGDLVLRGLGWREHLIQHHHSVFDGDLEKEKRKNIHEIGKTENCLKENFLLKFR